MMASCRKRLCRICYIPMKQGTRSGLRPCIRCCSTSWIEPGLYGPPGDPPPGGPYNPDRKSTRLNSSHVAISYAVFCLKTKNSNHHMLYHTCGQCVRYHHEYL